MRRIWRSVLIVAVLAACSPAFGAVYNDSVGDLHNGVPAGDNFSGFTHLDIVSVEVSNDASDITFTITLNGNIATAGGVDWGKYMVGIDSLGSDPGDSTVPGSNPWGPRPITMPTGMDYWLGSWADGGGGHQVWNYNDTTPGIWANPAGNEGVDLSQASSGKISFTVGLSELGLGIGDTIGFDVYSSGGGGGDSAIDALSTATPSVLTWGQEFVSLPSSLYTIVPEPATLVLCGLGALAMGLGCKRRRR
jgi:hypothetical protein